MPSQNIQWFPGHMAKTRRLIKENLSSVDFVIEMLDARIPISSKNPEIQRLCGDKPILTVLNKASLANPKASEMWKKQYESEGKDCIFIDCITGQGISEISESAKKMLGEKLERYRQKGMEGRKLRAMILGIPNVGKSSLINRITGKKKTKVEDRPGVTLQKQWVPTNVGFDLLDMPGILWPKFEDQIVGENLAITGAIKDDVVDIESLAITLCKRLREIAPVEFAARYKLGDKSEWESLENHELFELVGRKRGFLVSGGEVDYERTAKTLLDEFRGAKIGRITLEFPQ